MQSIKSNNGFVGRLGNQLPLLSFSLLFILLLFVGGTALYGFKHGRQALLQQEHNYSVVQHLLVAVSSQHNFKKHYQTFLISSLEVHQRAADRAENRLRSELIILERLIDDSVLQQRVVKLRSLVQRQSELVNQLVSIRREEGLEATLSSSVAIEAEQLATKINQRLDKIEALEDFRLQQDKQINDDRDRISTFSLVIAMLLSLLTLLGTLRAWRRGINQHRFSEKRLQDSETRLRALFNTTAIGIIVIDEHGLIEEFNPACETIFGYAHEEVIGRKINMLMPEPNSSKHNDYLKNYLATGKSNIIGTERELVGCAKGNRLFPLELHVGEASFGNHRIFVGFVKDITTRKEMEAKNRHFEAMVQSSDDAIMSKTLDGIVTSWNASAEKMFGYTAKEMIGNPMMRLFPPERIDEEKYFLEQLSQGQHVSHFETVRVHKNGSSVDVSVSLSPILDETGSVMGVSKIARDIARSKQLERDLQAAKQTAEAASRAKSEFLANMSHEIRTPMNAIIGLTRLAMETTMTTKQRDYLSKIQRSSQALLAILNDVLDLSKIESGRLDVERIEFNPTQVLQGVADLFAARLEEKGLELFLDIAPEIPLSVVSDPLRLQQILSNLLSNAIKFTETGEIHVRMEVLKSRADDLILRLSVRDTGIGISDSAMQQLFQPFSQVDTSITRKFGGTGLGLVISQHLAEMLGGSISVASESGQGSTFSFTVRCGKGQRYNWQKDSFRLRGTRVLVVDDQLTSCQMLKSLMESWSFRVETALSAEEGLRMIYAAENAGAPFDLLLVDWQMPAMSGVGLVLELRQAQSVHKLRRQPVIVMVTAYNKEPLLKEAGDRSARIDGFLAKPVVPSSLLNTILNVFHCQHIAQNDWAQTAKHSPYEAARPLRNAHVLLVEDNELNQQVAGEFLEKAGLRVSLAYDGAEALRKVQEEKFDVVLMDIQMPEMDGYEATRRIRELPQGRNLPIIAMTAAVMEEDREACSNAGMNGHVGKPIDPKELIEVLLHWIKPTSEEALPVLSKSDNKTCEDLQNKLPGFDLNNILLILGDDRTQLFHMLSEFREQFGEEANEIKKYLEAGELKVAEKRLHKLKGVAGNLGAVDLFRASQTLDSELQHNAFKSETLDQWLEAFDKTLATLDGISSQSSLASVSENDIESLDQIVQELDTVLAQDGFVEDNLLSRLKTLLKNDQQTVYDTIVKYINTTDYAQARSTLKTLL